MVLMLSKNMTPSSKEMLLDLIANLSKEFNYTEEGARQVSLYVVDKNLASKF
jgi:FMN-dependent NADH-azoreductase